MTVLPTGTSLPTSPGTHKSRRNAIQSWLAAATILFAIAPSASTAADPISGDADKSSAKKIVLVAGKPSHPPRMHEFNAGVQLLHKCLQGVEGVEAHFVLNGWPENESIFDGADAIVFYMDGGGRHELVQEKGRRLELAKKWADAGVGIGCMHYGVEVVAEQAGETFKHLIGGHYDHMFSCNPIWEPSFAAFPDHPITRGVQPFTAKDEWYFNMRFIGDVTGNEPAEVSGQSLTPILVAVPSTDVRDGPYVYPKGPYPHIEASKGRAEAMMWVTEREDGGRGMGFTGGHFHDNWADENFRKVVLNSFLWLARAEVPEHGVVSELETNDINQNLDPK